MKSITAIVVLALAVPAFAQDKPAAKEAAKPAAKSAAKPAAEGKGKIKFTQRRFEDARRCLDQPTNDAIIKCAEEYL